MMDFKKRFGNNVRNARVSSAITQKELAQRIGTSVPTISMYETGRRTPNAETLRALADALGSSIDSLVPHIPDAKRMNAGTIGLLRDMPRIYEDHDADCLFIDQLATALGATHSWGVAWCPIHNMTSGSYGDIIDAIILLAEKAEAYDDMVSGGEQ